MIFTPSIVSGFRQSRKTGLGGKAAENRKDLIAIYVEAAGILFASIEDCKHIFREATESRGITLITLSALSLDAFSV
jgi:hypothetical protein